MRLLKSINTTVALCAIAALVAAWSGHVDGLPMLDAPAALSFMPGAQGTGSGDNSNSQPSNDNTDASAADSQVDSASTAPVPDLSNFNLQLSPDTAVPDLSNSGAILKPLSTGTADAPDPTPPGIIALPQATATPVSIPPGVVSLRNPNVDTPSGPVGIVNLVPEVPTPTVPAVTAVPIASLINAPTPTAAVQAVLISPPQQQSQTQPQTPYGGQLTGTLSVSCSVLNLGASQLPSAASDAWYTVDVSPCGQTGYYRKVVSANDLISGLSVDLTHQPDGSGSIWASQRYSFTIDGPYACSGATCQPGSIQPVEYRTDFTLSFAQGKGFVSV